MASTGQLQLSLKKPNPAVNRTTTTYPVYSYQVGSGEGKVYAVHTTNPAVNREGDKLIITPLGAGNEVGRSCVFMPFKGKKIMFDCGIHQAYSGTAALPYFDEIDPASIDVLLVTDVHLDHAASLPYFLEKTTFRGRVFMTHATKAMYKLLLSEYVKVSKVSVEEMLFDENDVSNSMNKIEVIDFHQNIWK